MHEKQSNYVAYYRVSTQKQGYSGLGLEAQQEIIHNYLHDINPIAEFTEIESGRKKDRPKLKEALALCRKTGATLIVAKLDRLARNVAFLSQLLESDVEIEFCDFPQANKMMLHILSAISQYEAELVSTRTRQALQAKKSRGYTLGNPEHLLDKHSQAIARSVETNKAKANTNPNNMRAIAMIRVLLADGMNLKQIASKLNADGFVTSRGCKFSAATVYAIIKRNNLKTSES